MQPLQLVAVVKIVPVNTRAVRHAIHYTIFYLKSRKGRYITHLTDQIISAD